MSDDASRMLYLKTDSIPSSIKKGQEKFQEQNKVSVDYVINWDEFKGKGQRAYEQLDSWVQLVSVMFFGNNSLTEGKFKSLGKPAVEKIKSVIFKNNDALGAKEHKCCITGDKFVVEMNFAKSENQSSDVRDDIGKSLVEL
jgi:hypothetical protein